MGNKRIGGRLITPFWQSDFRGDGVSCSQSYLIDTDYYTEPSQSLKSSEMNRKPWSTMSNQTVSVTQWQSGILRVTVSYGFGASTSTPEQEEIRADQLSTQISKNSAEDNILAHPELRQAGVSGDDAIKLSLLANGQIVKKANGLYGYSGESTKAKGTITPPSNAKALEFFNRLEQGEKTFSYIQENINYSYRTKSPDIESMMTTGFKNPTLPKMIKLPTSSDGREWMITSYNVSYSGNGYYDVNLTVTKSNYGGYDSYLYTQQEN